MKKGTVILQSPLDAAYQLGERYNVSDIARKLGVSPVVMANKLNPHQEFHKLSLGEAVAITELTNDNGILESWCQQRGGLFVKLPDDISCDEELSDQLMRLSEQLGAALGEIRLAREDGVIDSHEFERIKGKLMGTITEALALECCVAGQVRDLPVKPTLVSGK